MRVASGVALSVVAAGAAVILDARPAAATSDEQHASLDGCCSLLWPSTPWCSHYCAENGFRVFCWACNPDASCACCECLTDSNFYSCWSASPLITACSYRLGCCY